MTTESPVPNDSLLMAAWNAYKATPEYANTLRWATDTKWIELGDDRAEGQLWAAFCAGYTAQSQPGDMGEARSGESGAVNKVAAFVAVTNAMRTLNRTEAARYRFLREQDGRIGNAGEGPGSYWRVERWHNRVCSTLFGDKLDAAIDRELDAARDRGAQGREWTPEERADAEQFARSVVARDNAQRTGEARTAEGVVTGLRETCAGCGEEIEWATLYLMGNGTTKAYHPNCAPGATKAAEGVGGGALTGECVNCGCELPTGCGGQFADEDACPGYKIVSKSTPPAGMVTVPVEPDESPIIYMLERQMQDGEWLPQQIATSTVIEKLRRVEASGEPTKFRLAKYKFLAAAPKPEKGT